MTSAAPGSPHRLGELIEPLRRIPRSELGRLLIPVARLVRIGGDTDGAEAPEDQRVERSTQCESRLGIAALGGATKGEACSGDVAVGERGAAAREEGREVPVRDPRCGGWWRSDSALGLGGRQ